MSRRLLSLVRPYSTLSLIGMSKNAGKTTVLGRLLEEYGETGEILGLSSIGRDGEAKDLVTYTAKPGIYIRSGTLFATASGLLAHCDVTREIIDCTGMMTPLGEIILLRALSDGQVQLGGPSMVSQMLKLRELFFMHGAARVIIDGAVSRKSLAAPSLSDAVILCTGASLGGGMEHVVAETAYFCTLAQLPLLADEPLRRELGERAEGKLTLLGERAISEDEPSLFRALRRHSENATHTVFIDGGLTDSMLEGLSGLSRTQPPPRLVLRDAGKCLISRDNYNRLAAGGFSLCVLERINLVAVTVNPFSAQGMHFPAEEFKAAMAAATALPVFNVEEELT